MTPITPPETSRRNGRNTDQKDTTVNPSSPRERPQQASQASLTFAITWLCGTPDDAVHTVHIITLVQELLTILRDDQIPITEAHRSLRRAVGLLKVFASEPQPHRKPMPGQHDYPPGRATIPQTITPPAEVQRFASQTLRGSLRDAIRTEPVIEILKVLLITLSNNTQPGQAHTAVRRTVNLLNFYLADHE